MWTLQLPSFSTFVCRPSLPSEHSTLNYNCSFPQFIDVCIYYLYSWLLEWKDEDDDEDWNYDWLTGRQPTGVRMAAALCRSLCLSTNEHSQPDTSWNLTDTYWSLRQRTQCRQSVKETPFSRNEMFYIWLFLSSRNWDTEFLRNRRRSLGEKASRALGHSRKGFFFQILLPADFFAGVVLLRPVYIHVW